MTNEQHIENLKKLKSFHNGSYGADIDRAIKALGQEPCDDEYIKVPKKALKYRTAGMVAYNAEWLKNHFDIERIVICGAQQPCDDAISRENAIVQLSWDFPNLELPKIKESLDKLPSVTPQPKTGHWIVHEIESTLKWLECSNCRCETSYNVMHNYCPNCGAKMVEPQETETWNGYHGQITAPKGTFEQIFNDADDDNDI